MIVNYINTYIKKFITINHKNLGLAYITFGLFSGIMGGFLSTIIRIELITPGSFLISGSEITYNIIITYHGLLMIFYAAMPIFISGLGNYIIPLSVGSKDMSLPKLNNTAFWFIIASFLILISSSGFYNNTINGANYGWTIYPPLSTNDCNKSIDLLILALHLNGISSLINAINAIITIKYNSALNRWQKTPFIWSILITSYLIILVMPVLVVGITTLLTDHSIKTCFYTVEGGGDPVLFQHLFWFFGHPEVYILILPAFGIISEAISENIGGRIIGDKAMIWSMISIAVIGCFVWGHHMYTVGMDLEAKCYFTIATSLIALPTGLKIFLWTGSYISNNIKNNTINTLIILFITTFVLGGVTGLWLSQSNLDLLLHDTYFVVAHFHYILAVCLIYVFFIITYSYNKFISQTSYKKKYSKIHILSFFIGTNLLFMPMHIIGINGMPRRILDYPSCFTTLNEISTLGEIIILYSIVWLIFSTTPQPIEKIKNKNK